MIALVCATILGFVSIYLWVNHAIIWIVLVCVGIFVLLVPKKEVWVRGPWTPRNMREILARNTEPPVSVIKAIHEKHDLNKEAKIENPEAWRRREIAKRLIFLDGYLAAKRQERTSQ